MSDSPETKASGPTACNDKGVRDAAFRSEIRRERSRIAKRVESARVRADVPELLRLLISEIVLWTRELKMETLTLFEDTDHGHFARRMMRDAPTAISILPGYIVFPFLVLQDARDVVELAVGEAQAKALANRFDAFDGHRRQFGEAVAELACVWDDAPDKHLEQLVVIDRHRSDLKHAAMDLCRYVDTLANFAAARSAGDGHNRVLAQPAVETVDLAAAPADRLRSLRQTFDRAVKRLDSLPDTELSPSGQPFIQECSEAMLAFAAWFGEQTPDDLPLLGNAHRVYYALGGLSGVIDWVALRWSVPFAKELDEETAMLVEQADALDKAVVKAFKLPSEAHELRLTRKPLSDRVCGDLEERIEAVSGQASRLGRRLQRLAVWASEGHQPTPRAPGDRTLRRGQDWQFEALPDGQTTAYHRAVCEQYASLEPFDLLAICESWRTLATSFTDAACRSGHHGAHVVHDASVLRVTRLLETACADRQLDGVDRMSRCLRRPDTDHLHWALATLDKLEAQLRAEAVNGARRPTDGVVQRSGVNGVGAVSTAGNVEAATPPFQIVESAFQVTMDGRTYTFKKRNTKLFALLLRIARRPGHRVQFDALREKGDVWDGYDADDSTIRGAIKRLKDRLRGARMEALANSISTGTFENRQYVIMAADCMPAKSN